MKTRTLLPAAALVLCGSFAAWAVDPPHWSSTAAVVDCSSCHTGHSAPGGTLNTASGDVNLCQSCHKAGGAADPLILDNADKAQPGVSGIHHAFDVPAANASLGASVPTNTQMAARVMVGNIVCSTCHNAHLAAVPAAAGGDASPLRGTPRISTPAKTLAAGGTGVLSAGGTYTATSGSWYLVEIMVAGNGTTARFRYSKDGGTSWFPAAGPYTLAAASVAIDGGNVTLSFGAGTYALTERWEFYASLPFLRAPLDQVVDQFCRDCHADMVMDHLAVRAYDGSYKSHPVGVTLGVNGGGYDRPAPLDGNGTAQGGAGNDTIASNNLQLFGTGTVQCLTCHGVHYADSNTATEDRP